MLLYKRVVSFLLAFLIVSPIHAFSAEPESTDIPILSSEETELEQLYAQLTLVPLPILQAFIERGWAVYIDDIYLEKLSREYGYTCIAATSYKNKGIYLTDAASLLHEFGHFLHYTLNFDKESETLFQAEAQGVTFLRTYAKRNFREYFADCFAYWIKNRENQEALALMWAQAPETFRYFSGLEQEGWIRSD